MPTAFDLGRSSLGSVSIWIIFLIMATVNRGTSPPPPIEDEEPIVAENWCRTEINVEKFSYMWTINKFSMSQDEVGEALSSCPFSNSDNKLKWCLQIYPKGLDEESKECLSLYLLLLSCNKNEVHAKFKISIISAQNEERLTVGTRRAYRFVQGKDWGFKHFTRSANLFQEASHYLHEDKLTLYCEVSVISDYANTSGQTCPIQYKVPECHLSDDMGELFENKKFSDVILSVDGQDFYAHKAILAARSPVFEAMFERHMIEEGQNRIEITDMDADVLKALLQFIYTGRLHNLENLCDELLAAAAKYALSRLKFLCEEQMCKNLSVESAAKTLVLADLHDAEKLKACAIEYINSNAQDVMETRGWKRMVQMHPQLIAKVFRALATQKSPQVIARKRCKMS